MEKIIVAVDPHQLNTNVVDFACYIAKLTRSELTAIFLDNDREASTALRRGLTRFLHELVAEPAGEESRSRIDLTREQVDFFEGACLNRGVRASVNIDCGVPVKELIIESRFADLLIVDPELTSVKELLAKSECPVVIAPYEFNGIDEILFVYDGTASSTFAIKQFAHLFPELGDMSITVAEIKTEKQVWPVLEKKKLGSFLQMHYSSIGFRVMQGNSGNELLSYLLNKKNVFVVSGLPLETMAVNLPVFVTHQ
jgi:hypothetical protein